MGFTDFAAATGLTALNSFLETRSYIVGQTPTQADVTVYNAITTAPDAAEYPHAARWYKHIASHQGEFDTLAGDKSTDISQYGPEVTAAAVNPAAAPAAEEDSDDEDLFASEDEEETAEKAALTAKRLAEYKEKKDKKPATIAKSIVTLDVKPWDDETDLEQMKANVLAIEMDGLTWGGSSFVAVGFGIKKLQINVVVEDSKVSVDDLQQKIEEDEDHVQSTDVAAMQKL